MWQAWLSWWRKRRRVIRVTMLIAAPVAAIVSWMVIQHKPAWYAPAQLDEVARRRARRAAAAGESVGETAARVGGIACEQFVSALAGQHDLDPLARGAREQMRGDGRCVPQRLVKPLARDRRGRRKKEEARQGRCPPRPSR